MRERCFSQYTEIIYFKKYQIRLGGYMEPKKIK